VRNKRKEYQTEATPSKVSLNLSFSKLAKSAEKIRNNQKTASKGLSKETYKDQSVFKLRKKDPSKYIQTVPFRFTDKTENERLISTIKKLHPMGREGFDIEGYHYYWSRPVDSSKFLDTKEIRHRLNDLKTTIAESTYKTEPKHSQSVYSVQQMINESKVTLRSSEPYIGGEKETGSRMHRYRNKSRELVYCDNRASQNRTANSDRLLTSNYNKRTKINKSIDNSSFFHEPTMIILEKSRLDTAENIQQDKLVSSNTKIRPVSAYTHSGLREVGINYSSETKTSAQWITRPSTSAQPSFKPKINYQINHSKSPMNNGTRLKEYSSEDLSRTLNRFTNSVHEEPKSPIQLYYKSVEPYLRKK
jgi:hypothetical protein